MCLCGCVRVFVLQEPLFGMLTAPLESSLIRLDEELKEGALNVFILVDAAISDKFSEELFPMHGKLSMRGQMWCQEVKASKHVLQL